MADNLDVRKWTRRAQMDFDGASVLVKNMFRPPIEVVCFLCQQSAEKILKAYTIAQKGSRTRSHELEDLLDECIPYSADFSNIKDCCVDLSPYLGAARYPSEIDITEYDMKKALNDAAQILEFTKAKLKELGYEYLPEQGKM